MKWENSSKSKRKIIAIVLALSLPFSVLAQGGLFQRGENPEGLRSSDAATLTNQGFGNPISGSSLTNNAFGNYVEGSNLTNQTFGVPIGSGLFVMLMAGAGYAALKTNKKTNKK